MSNIILASQSPRRKQLLEQACIKFEVVVGNTDEHFNTDTPFEQIPVLIAKEKAIAVADKINNTSKTIIAADTVVVLNNEIIGKPKSRDEAIHFLKKLSGNKHQVITGVVILFNNHQVEFSDTTDVEFHTLTQQQIEFYVDEYKPYDKAGAYAIQEWIGAVGIKKINGDFYNVMGLPISRVVHELLKYNLLSQNL